MNVFSHVTWRPVLGSLLAGALFCGLAGCDSDKGQQMHGAANAVLEVSVVTMQPQTISVDFAMEGRVRARQIADVRPQVNGILQKRLFEEGDDVKEGDILYQIDPLIYRAALASAKATLARAEAQLLPAKLKMERYKTLIAKNAVSRQDWNDVDAAYKQAVAEVGVAKAAVDSAQIQLDYTEVKAPITGRTGRSMMTVGALMTANQPDLLTTVTQLDPVFVDVTQASSVMLELEQQLKSGKLDRAEEALTKIRLRLENGSEYEHEGTLTFTGTRVDEHTGSVTLRAEFPNPEHTLLPGMYVRALLTAGTNANALLTPLESIQRDTKGSPFVYVVKSDGMVEARPVLLGQTFGQNWHVLKGLEVGERVAVDNLQKIHNGSMVKAVDKPMPSDGTVSSLRENATAKQTSGA